MTPGTHWIWDIETVPLPDDQLQALMPEELRNPQMPYELERPVMPTFENRALKDPVKIDEWHNGKVREWQTSCKAAIEKWRAATMEAQLKFIDRAPLSAATGSIALIGMRELESQAVTIYAATADHKLLKLDEHRTMILCGTEENLIRQFWGRVEHLRKNDFMPLIGIHSNRFDLPFVVRRSCINRVRIPVPITSGAYIDRSLWCDLHERWQCGDRQEMISVDNLAKALGTQPKSGKGDVFWKLWRDDKQAAVQYLCDDLETTAQIARAMGVGQ